MKTLRVIMLAHVQGLKCWKRLTSLGTNRARFTRLGRLDVNVEMLQPFELWANERLMFLNT